MQYIFVLGRQPKLSLAELESVYGSNSVQPWDRNLALIETPDKPNINQLGGTIKIVEVSLKINSNSWQNIWPVLQKQINNLVKNSRAKITFGVSVYGLKVPPQIISKTLIAYKKELKQTKDLPPLRIVNPLRVELSSAQIIHNRLTKTPNFELVIATSGQTTLVGTTVSVQDIDFYGKRDYGRPKRDARVGMLPPKLAQIMVNLGTWEYTARKQQQALTILDPFCGTGVILQESLLMGYDVVGSDIDERMVRYSRQNIKWLIDNFHPKGKMLNINTADACEHNWQKPIDCVVSETYLGPPLRYSPGSDRIEEIRGKVDQILTNCLNNLHEQLKTGARLCLAVPAWRTKSRFIHLKTVDRLEKLGYTRQSFSLVKNSDLIYHRFGQVVAREIIILTRK